MKERDFLRGSAHTGTYGQLKFGSQERNVKMQD